MRYLNALFLCAVSVPSSGSIWSLINHARLAESEKSPSIGEIDNGFEFRITINSGTERHFARFVGFDLRIVAAITHSLFRGNI